MNSTSNRRVLIVDDNRAIHDDFRKILCPPASTRGQIEAVEDALFGNTDKPPEFEPITVDSAYQGQEALQFVQRGLQEGRPYAMAFVDVRMPPGWDGIQTTRELWKVDPDLQVVICTAYSDYSWGEMISQLGQSDRLVVLKKPFDNIEALQLAQALTTKWDLSRQARRRVEELDRLVAERTEQLRSVNKKLLDDIAIRKQTELRLAVFATLGKRLGAAENAKAAAEIIVDVADQLLGWDACVCDLYSAAEDRVYHVLNMDLADGLRREFDSAEPANKPTGIARKAIHEGGQLILRTDLEAPTPEAMPFGNKTLRSASILYVPIRNGASVVGVLSIQSYKKNAYDPHSLETLQALADHCAGALNRIKSEESLRQAEQQLRQAQKMEAVGQLAGGVAHDFNNLLAVILGNAELASNDPAVVSPDTTHSLGQIIDAANRAANLTRQLLAFGRKQIVQAKPLNLNQHLTNVSDMLKRIIGEDIRLHCAYAGELPLIQADPSMIDQVIMNLVVNARDAMPEGGKLQIATQTLEFDSNNMRSHPEARVGRFVCVSVTDTGTGIKPENLTHIFEPFFTTKDVGKGTGLGLATVFGIVKQHRGWVEVHSKVGAGTTFQIFLPALDPAAPLPGKLKGRGGIPQPSSQDQFLSVIREQLDEGARLNGQN